MFLSYRFVIVDWEQKKNVRKMVLAAEIDVRDYKAHGPRQTAVMFLNYNRRNASFWNQITVAH